MQNTKVAIIVCLRSIFGQIKEEFKSDLPKAWFDFDEVDEIIITLFKNTISGILNAFNPKDKEVYKQCYQGNIDYLEYSGLTTDGSFRVAHQAEMLILKAIFDTYPTLDDINKIRITDYRLVDKQDLVIICEIKYETNSYSTNNPYTGIV